MGILKPHQTNKARFKQQKPPNSHQQPWNTKSKPAPTAPAAPTTARTASAPAATAARDAGTDPELFPELFHGPAAVCPTTWKSALNVDNCTSSVRKQNDLTLLNIYVVWRTICFRTEEVLYTLHY